VIKLKGAYAKLTLAFVLALTLAFSQSYASSAASAAVVDGGSEYGQFLEEKYGVSFEGNVTKGDLIKAVAEALDLKAATSPVFSDLSEKDSLYEAAAALYDHGILQGPAIDGEQPLTKIVAVSIAVRAADLSELAYTYPVAKANKVVTGINVVPSHLTGKVAQELAAAVDTGLLSANLQKEFKPGAAVDNDFLNELLGQVLVTKGLYKNYIGYVSDTDIYAKLQNAYATSDIIVAPQLQELVNTALKQELVTGYNLKDSRYNSNFIESLSLTYGHSDLKHAVQLIGLLRSEGLDAKVQFEPKTSAFIFLAEWGNPGPNVVQIENGNYITYDKEYDLVFEFATDADKAAFQDVILSYAKKNEADQKGLIAGSWWQPLYYSLTELADYEIISNNKITIEDSVYYVNSFSLNEDVEKVANGFKAIDPEASVETYQFWVDKPFFNYLHGESL